MTSREPLRFSRMTLLHVVRWLVVIPNDVFGGWCSYLKFVRNSWEERMKSVFRTLFKWHCRIISIFAYNYWSWCIWHSINVLNSMEEQGIAAELKNYGTIHWKRNGKEQVHFFAVTFHDVRACFSQESFVYRILWSSGFELAPSHMRGPGFKFQYGAWLSRLMFFMVFLIPFQTNCRIWVQILSALCSLGYWKHH